MSRSPPATRPTALRRWLRIGLILLTSLAVLGLAAIVWLRTAVELGVTSQPTIPPPPTAAAAPGSTRPVLILLHGAGLNGHMWDAALRRLDPRWRYIALDLPGHGSHQAEDFTLEAAAASVARAAQAVSPAPVILVGDSLGGYVAMASAAAVPPQQLRGLVLAGCSHDVTWHDRARLWVQSTFVRALIARSTEREFFTRAVAKVGFVGEDARNVVAGGMALRGFEQGAQAIAGVDFRAKLAAIPQPVLIANGTLDLSNMQQEDLFLAAARHGSKVNFENTAHGISIRKSSEFAEMVNGFAERAFGAAPRP
ncbi:MAG: alpha/beta fold hydrolase [Burkholderiales bacterium]|nr:alpha/beta fold hydrolase [Burkholderiales bacterium]